MKTHPRTTGLRPAPASSIHRPRIPAHLARAKGPSYAGRGFTLVELLAATVLSALLMVAMLMVIAGFGAERKLAAARAAREVPPQLTDLLRWDLLHARDIRIKRGSITLGGYGSLDRRTLALHAHTPVQVVYEVRHLAGRPWLVRTQWSDGGGDVASELVCAGVKDIVILPLNMTDGPAELPRLSEIADKKLAMTAQVWMKVAFDSPARRPIDQVVVLR